jgi:inorganic pyrophosphatase/exopolyphosphatase
VLTRIAGIADVDAFAQGLFDAKSSVNGLPANEIVQMDYKTYTLASKTVGFGVAETLTPEPLLVRKVKLSAPLTNLGLQAGAVLTFPGRVCRMS